MGNDDNNNGSDEIDVSISIPKGTIDKFNKMPWRRIFLIGATLLLIVTGHGRVVLLIPGAEAVLTPFAPQLVDYLKNETIVVQDPGLNCCDTAAIMLDSCKVMTWERNPNTTYDSCCAFLGEFANSCQVWNTN